jgi:hypothetical protein
VMVINLSKYLLNNTPFLQINSLVMVGAELSLVNENTLF